MAGFLKRMFSFGRDDRAKPAEAERQAVPEPAATEPAATEPDAAEPPRTDAPAEDGLVARGEGVVTERPLDAGRGPDPRPLPDVVEPKAHAAPPPVPRTDDPGDGLDPAASPVPPSDIAGGTVTDHATNDAVALEQSDVLPPAGGTPGAGRADPGADGATPTHTDADATPDAGTPDRDTSEPPPPPERAAERAAKRVGERVGERPRPNAFSTAEPAPERQTSMTGTTSEAPRGFLARLRAGLGRSSQELSRSITGVFRGRKLDDDTLEELEDVLLRADLGTATAARIVERLSEGRHGRDVEEGEVRRILAAEVARVLEPVAEPLDLDLTHRPHVILVVGVNGTGKTTTIGKLAAKLRRGGLDVMLAAGDTFRAAAIEQLHLWGERVGAEVVSTRLGADAAGLAHEAHERAVESGADVLLIDTAGRLQNRAELMDELAKVVRVLKRRDPTAPHTVLQTLDATTGQNALAQVEAFRETAGVGGLVMTKLDGTARGGVLVAVAARFGLPVWFVGVGEGVDDLEPFRADEFAASIAGIERERV